MNIFQKVTLATLKKNRMRTMVTIIGVILSTAMITAVTVFFSSMQGFMQDSIKATVGDWHAVLPDVPADKVDESMSRPELSKAVYTETIGMAKYTEYKNGYQEPYLYITGFTKESYQSLPVYLEAGRMPENSSEIVMYRYNLSEIDPDLNIGDEIELELGSRYLSGDALADFSDYIEGESLKIKEKRTYTIVGFYKSLDFERYKTPGRLAITVAEKSPSHHYSIYYNMKNPKEIFTYSEEKFQPFVIDYNEELLRSMGVMEQQNFYSVYYSLGVILILLIMGGSILLIYNAFSISVSERTKQFGLLSSVGATKKQIKKSIRFEALVVSGIGIPIGCLSGVLGIGLTLKIIGEALGQQFYNSNGAVSLSLHVSLFAIVLAALIALVTVLISAWIPALRSSRLTVMEALRQNEDIRIKPGKLKTFAFVYRLFGLEGMLANKNYKRNSRKYRSTIISLVLSMVLFISASALVQYLKISSGTVLDIPDADIYYNAYSSEENMLDFNAMFEKLRADKTVIDSDMIKSTMMEIAFDESLLLEDTPFGFSMVDGIALANLYLGVMRDQDFIMYANEHSIDASYYIDAERPVGILYDQITNYSEQSGRYEKKSILIDHKPRDFKIQESIWDDEKEEYVLDTTSSLYGKEVTVGYLDVVDRLPASMYDRNMFVIVLPESQYERFFSQYNFAQSAIMSFKTTDHELAYQNMKQIIATNPIFDYENVTLRDQAAQVESDRNLILAINVLSYGFIALISLIAAANVFNTISTGLRLRRREFAMLRSVGMTKKGLQKMMNYECILIGSKSILFGIPISMLVTYAIYRSMLRGVDLSLVMPWTGILIACVSVFLVVFSTMLFSMQKIKKENTMDALKKETL